jgi:hypothetical protein
LGATLTLDRYAVHMTLIKSNAPGIKPKAYQHFAIVTIAIAVIVAVFSSGDTQEQMAKTKANKDLKMAEEVKLGKTKLVDKRDPETRHRMAAAAFDSDPGPPMDMGGAGGSVPEAMPANVTTGNMTVMIEPNATTMAKLDPAQRKKYLKDLEDAAKRIADKGHYMPSQQQLEILTTASAARAGPPTTD